MSVLWQEIQSLERWQRNVIYIVLSSTVVSFCEVGWLWVFSQDIYVDRSTFYSNAGGILLIATAFYSLAKLWSQIRQCKNRQCRVVPLFQSDDIPILSRTITVLFILVIVLGSILMSMCPAEIKSSQGMYVVVYTTSQKLVTSAEAIWYGKMIMLPFLGGNLLAGCVALVFALTKIVITTDDKKIISSIE